MTSKNLIAFTAATTMMASPVLAASTNSASSLSISHARVGTPSAKKSALAGGGAGIFALLIVAGIVAIVVVDATKDDNSDSN